VSGSLSISRLERVPVLETIGGGAAADPEPPDV